MLRRLVSCSSKLLVPLVLCVAGRAAAHGSPPAVTQVVSAEPGAQILATTRGLVFGDPTGTRWSLLCGAAFGVPADFPYRAVQLPSGRLLVGDLEGLRMSDDRGCSWKPHPRLGTLDLTDLVQDPAAPARLYLSSFGQGEGGIRMSDDGGETFRVLFRARDDEFVGTLLVAGAQPGTVYASLSTTAERPQFFVLRSVDGGASWERSELALGRDAFDVSLLAVNPAEPRELLLRVYTFDEREGDRLLRSSDGGRTITEVGRFLRVADAAFSSDGSAAFIGTSEGLFRASTTDFQFVRAGDSVRVSHLAVADAALLVAGTYEGAGGLLDRAVQQTTLAATPPRLQPWMSLKQVTEPYVCPAPSTVGCDCVLGWLDWILDASPNPSLTDLPNMCGP